MKENYNILKRMFSDKRKSKKLTALAGSLCMFFLSAGCSEKNAVSDTTQKTIKIAAVYYPQYIMCLNLTQNIPDVELFLPVSTGMFSFSDYELTINDLSEISSCDILVINGAGMEHIPAQILKIKENKLIVAAEKYPLINNNPYIWMAPSGARYEILRIACGLANLDPVHAQQYKSNAKIYEKKLDSLSNEMKEALAAYKQNNVITFYEPVRYLANEFGLNILSVIKCKSGAVLGKNEYAGFLSQIKSVQKNSKNICLYAEQQFSPSTENLIETKTGLVVNKIDPCVSGPFVPDAYTDAQEKNLLIFVQSLSGNYDDEGNR
jgi:zinc transport system substrate-binding protein